jgi:hypothetical protein
MQCIQLPIADIVVHLGLARMAVNMTKGRFSEVTDHASQVLHYIYTNVPHCISCQAGTRLCCDSQTLWKTMGNSIKYNVFKNCWNLQQYA